MDICTNSSLEQPHHNKPAWKQGLPLQYPVLRVVLAIALSCQRNNQDACQHRLVHWACLAISSVLSQRHVALSQHAISAFMLDKIQLACLFLQLIPAPAAIGYALKVWLHLHRM